MAIFINWFEVEYSSTRQFLPFRDFGSWEDSRAAHEVALIPDEVSARFTVRDGEQELARTVLIAPVESMSGFEEREFDIHENSRIASKIITLNLGNHLRTRGFNVDFHRFMTDATRPTFEVSEIGLAVETGVAFKPFHVREENKHGITLQWRVKQQFRKPLSEFATSVTPALNGIPVILTSATGADSALTEFAGRYVGVVTAFAHTDSNVLCRDGVTRKIPSSLLIPEAKPDVITSLAKAFLPKGAESIQRRILATSFSLTATGRRNLQILQDQLKAAVDALNPDNRPFVMVDLVPLCVGKIRISMAPGIANMQAEQYV